MVPAAHGTDLTEARGVVKEPVRGHWGTEGDRKGQ